MNLAPMAGCIKLPQGLVAGYCKDTAQVQIQYSTGTCTLYSTVLYSLYIVHVQCIYYKHLLNNLVSDLGRVEREGMGGKEVAEQYSD
jgi:hypothetical protein